MRWLGVQAQYHGLLAPLGKATLPEEQTQLLASFLPFLPLQNTVTIGGSFLLLLVQLPKGNLAPRVFCKLHLVLPGITMHAATRGPPEPPPPHVISSTLRSWTHT